MAAGNIPPLNWRGYLECAAVQSQPGDLLEQEIIFNNPSRKSTGKGTQLGMGKWLQDQGMVPHTAVVLTKKNYFLSQPHQGLVTFSPLVLFSSIMRYYSWPEWIYVCTHLAVIMAFYMHTMYILCIGLLAKLLLRLSWCFSLKLGFFFFNRVF